MLQIVLKKLRENVGMSQYSFAKDFGVAQSTVGNWESGIREPNLTTMQRLATYFHVSVDYLLTGQSEKPAFDEFHLNNTPTAQLPNEALEVAAKYAVAPEGIQSAIRKLLDIAENNLGISHSSNVG